jgi:type IV pilus assembly protein PilC
MDTLLSSGISMVRALEITADVVGNDFYKSIVMESVESIRAGGSLSEAFSKYKEMPRILVQMIKIGEETGKLGYVLKTVARFYKREVTSSIDTIVGLIEPVMIVMLAAGVGVLLVAVLGPIYNLTSSF